jgi:hypothetical protein
MDSSAVTDKTGRPQLPWGSAFSDRPLTAMEGLAKVVDLIVF